MAVTRASGLGSADKNAFNITIDHTKVVEDLYDFPLLVNLGADSGIDGFDSTNIFSELVINPNLLLMLASDQLISNGIIVDSSIYNTDISNTNTVHSQVVKKIGESSLLFNGNSHLSGNLHTALGDDDFTIDFWYYPESNANHIIMSVGSTGTNRLALQNYNGSIYFYNGSLSYTSLSAGFVAYTWVHVAIVRSGSNIKVYLDGIEVHSTVTPFTGNETNIGIGSSGGAVAFLQGNIDEFRIIKEAVWLSDFTPEVVHYTTGSLKILNAVYINPADTASNPMPSDTTIYSRQCKVEIDRWDQVNQQAQLWVKVPYISKDVDTIINLSFDSGNDDNSDNIGETGEVPAQAVWEDYFGVWHQSFDGADSTINANHGTLINMDDSNIVDFGVGKGLSFNGIDESITLPDLNHGSLNQFSLSVTAMSNDITMQASVVDLNNSTETSDPNVQVNINQGNVSNEIMYYTRHNATNQQHNENSDVTVSNTFDLVSTENSDMDAFLNGQDLSSVEVGVGDYVYSNDTLENKIGVHRLGAGFFEGNIKEIRLSKAIKSASYIATNYESTQDSLVTFSYADVYELNP
ncbi:MAG: LamG domain-containing protein [Gammaproteobacteria bacterium]|nr:LamG domain-containing protein [Gammaproteobacteria bacterium]